MTYFHYNLLKFYFGVNITIENFVTEVSYLFNL